MIERHLPIVRVIARRFAGRGEPIEDLVQVGTLALIVAVDRCDPRRERRFGAYAAVCVDGEIRRHLRDRCDPLRVPRRLQQDAAVVEAMRTTASLEDEAETLAAPAAEALEDVGIARALVASAARALDARERRIVALRYFVGLSQTEIAETVGISQVHVSRLLAKALSKMRLAVG
jgi:RNA polymerase sigma-B factor